MLQLIEGERVTRVLFSQQQISARVAELAAQINRDYAGRQVTLLGTLVGSSIFHADLARAVTLDVQLDFMKVSSYGSGTRSMGVVEMTHPPSLPLEGRHIIVVEDIVDTGYTAACLAEYFKDKNVASYAFCTFLNKPSRREVPDIECKYTGFDVEDVFVVGYGLDYAQRYRNLPYLGALEFVNVKEVS